MDDSEKLVREMLVNLTGSVPVFEPDGNVTPDFLVDGSIAVEVRRLNKSYVNDDDRPKGLEEDAIPLIQRIKTYLSGLEPMPNKNWYVFIKYSRPTPRWNALKVQLDRFFASFSKINNPKTSYEKLALESQFWVKLVPASASRPAFSLGGYNDMQSGGWLLDDIHTNLSLYIAEKSEKIASKRGKYPEWWLVLPNHIGLWLDEHDQRQFFEGYSVNPGLFDKVFLVDPGNSKRVMQVYPAPHST